VQLAYNNKREDLIPSWCVAQQDIHPPAVQPQEPVCAAASPDVATEPKKGKNRKRKARKVLNKKTALTREDEEEKTELTENSTPEAQTEQSLESRFALLTGLADVAPETVNKSQAVTFISAVTEELTFEEFYWSIKHRLAKLRDEECVIDEGWTTVTHNNKRTLPDLPEVPTYTVPNMYGRLRRLLVSDSTTTFTPEEDDEGLSKVTCKKERTLPELPELPRCPIVDMYPSVEHLEIGEVDEETWFRDMYRRLSDLKTKPLDEDAKWFSDMEKRVKALQTGCNSIHVGGGAYSRCAGTELRDVPTLDLANVPGIIFPHNGVGAKSKQAKKLRKKVKKELKEDADKLIAVATEKKKKAEALRESIDYCERKPQALQFAVELNKKQPIERETSTTEDTEEKQEEKQSTSTSFAGAMMGVLLQGVKEANEKSKLDAEAEREHRYASDTHFVHCNAPRESQSSATVSSELFGELFGAAAMDPPPSGNPPPTPPRPTAEEDTIRMPYGYVLPSDAAWSSFK
jgi:hypothetical protein